MHLSCDAHSTLFYRVLISVLAGLPALSVSVSWQFKGKNSASGNDWTQARLAEQLANRTGVGLTGGEHNFCQHHPFHGEKLLPSFYLLGAPKCATTSFSMELGRYGNVREAPKLWSAKEWHFWETFATGTEAEFAKKEFFDRLGDCPKKNRLVLGDYSITNLAAVPLPSGMELSPCSCKEGKKAKHGGDVPRLLHHAYGEQRKDVTFMVMLREPLSRMQSSWHHAKAKDFANYWGFNDCCLESFRKAVRTVLDSSKGGKFGGKIGGTGNVWASMYGRHLEAYLKYFDATQLIVVPYKLYSDDTSRKNICHELKYRLKTAMNCSTPKSFEENVHTHPPLSEEIGPKLREWFEKLMVPEKERLFKVLTSANLKGMRLFGYHGKKGDKQAVQKWLEENW